MQSVVESVFVRKLKAMRLEEAHRKAESRSTVHTPEQQAAHDRWLARGEDAMERLYHLAMERALLQILTSADHKGRTMLHYAACSRGLSVERLLDTGAGADFAARKASGGRLFPRTGHFCAQCGFVVSNRGAATEGDQPPQSPTRRSGHPNIHAAAPSSPGTPGRRRGHGSSRKAQPNSLASKLQFRRRPDDSLMGSGAGASMSIGDSADAAELERSLGMSATGASAAPQLEVLAAPGASAAPMCGKCRAPAVTVAQLQGVRADAVNASDMQGGTPLHYASAAGDVRACKSLLRQGADRYGALRTCLSPLRNCGNPVIAVAVPSP